MQNAQAGNAVHTFPAYISVIEPSEMCIPVPPVFPAINGILTSIHCSLHRSCVIAP